jgi:hypothetical protein
VAIQNRPALGNPEQKSIHATLHSAPLIPGIDLCQAGPASATYAAQKVGTTSAAKAFTLANKQKDGHRTLATG